jgi:uncharacterized protein
MKLCDIHAHIGPWPFRHLPFTDARSLLGEMDRLGIDRAAVCNTNGVFYINTQAANEELAEETRKFRDRLCPIATLNPLYVRAEEDFRECLESLGMVGLRLIPQYHGYLLDDPRAVAMAQAAGAAGLPVLVPRILVDPRQRHWMDIETTVPLETLAAFASKVSGATIIGTEYGFPADAATLAAMKAAPNLHFEISRIPYLNARAIQGFVKKGFSDRLMFGTGMPFKVPEVSMLKMELLEDKNAREKISGGTFQRIFGR